VNLALKEESNTPLMENIGSIWLTRSLGTRLWTWAQWLDRIGGRAYDASFELHGMRKRMEMVYS
jgi:hypothetical protein